MMNDDFNTAGAFGVLFELISRVNPLITSNTLNKISAKRVSAFLFEINNILGIIPKRADPIPEEVIKLIEEREKLRQDKNWTESDKIRSQVEDLGYELEDTIYGPLLRVK